MPERQWISLTALGAEFTEAHESPTRQTLISRGRQFAEMHGLRIVRVGRVDFVSRADVAAIAEGSAA